MASEHSNDVQESSLDVIAERDLYREALKRIELAQPDYAMSGFRFATSLQDIATDTLEAAEALADGGR